MNDPNNYRGSSFIYCTGKVFSSIISTRIKHYLDLTNRIGSEQAGFRKGYGCEDHTFSLTKLLSLYLANGKQVYATFLEYEKPFDLVDRAFFGRSYKIIISMEKSSRSYAISTQKQKHVSMWATVILAFSNVRLVSGRVIIYHHYCSQFL